MARLPNSFHVPAPEGRPWAGRFAFQAPDRYEVPREGGLAPGRGQRAPDVVPIPGNGTGGCRGRNPLARGRQR
jgi:hypothetical protein